MNPADYKPLKSNFLVKVHGSSFYSYSHVISEHIFFFFVVKERWKEAIRKTMICPNSGDIYRQDSERSMLKNQPLKVRD